MKSYIVKVPIVAFCYVEVKADNKKEAIKNALESDELKAYEKIRNCYEAEIIYEK